MVESLNQPSRSCSKIRSKQAKNLEGNFLVSSTQAARKRRGEKEGKGLKQRLFTVLEAGTTRCNVQYLAHMLHCDCSRLIKMESRSGTAMCVFVIQKAVKLLSCTSGDSLTPTGETPSKMY